MIESSAYFHVHGLVGQLDQVGKHVLGYSVLCSDHDLPTLRSQFGTALLAVGQIGFVRTESVFVCLS